MLHITLWLSLWMSVWFSFVCLHYCCFCPPHHHYHLLILRQRLDDSDNGRPKSNADDDHNTQRHWQTKFMHVFFLFSHRNAHNLFVSYHFPTKEQFFKLKIYRFYFSSKTFQSNVFIKSEDTPKITKNSSIPCFCISEGSSFTKTFVPMITAFKWNIPRSWLL